MPEPTLTGLRILVVEDQIIVALDIESVLQRLGCEVVGPVARLEPAIRMAREEALDAAVLDVNLDGESVGPVVQELRARGLPIILATGYGASALPDTLRGLPCLEKPITGAELETLLKKLHAPP